MFCKVCGDPTGPDFTVLGDGDWATLHYRCELIMVALEGLENTPKRALLHKINEYIARGVDD